MKRNLKILWSDIKAGLKHVSILVIMTMVLALAAIVFMVLAADLGVTATTLAVLAVAAGIVSLRE